MKLLTNREMELFRKLIYTEKRYQDYKRECSIPIERVAKEVAADLSFSIDEDDIAECIEDIRGTSSIDS